MQMIQFFVGGADSKIWRIAGGDLGFCCLRFTALFVRWNGGRGGESEMKTYCAFVVFALGAGWCRRPFVAQV